MPLTLVNNPSTMAREQSGLGFVVANPLTVPTTLNSSVSTGGQALNLIVVLGTNPYTLLCACPAGFAQKHSTVGYAYTVNVDAENVVTAAIPLTAKAGWDYSDLSSPVNTVGTLGEGYIGAAAVTNDQWVFESTTDPDSIGLSVDSQGYWTLDSVPLINNTALFYLIQADGSLEAEDTIIFNAVNHVIVGAIVRPLVRSLVRGLAT